jgi:hypothetical protein
MFFISCGTYGANIFNTTAMLNMSCIRNATVPQLIEKGKLVQAGRKSNFPRPEIAYQEPLAEDYYAGGVKFDARGTQGDNGLA